MLPIRYIAHRSVQVDAPGAAGVGVHQRCRIHRRVDYGRGCAAVGCRTVWSAPVFRPTVDLEPIDLHVGRLFEEAERCVGDISVPIAPVAYRRIQLAVLPLRPEVIHPQVAAGERFVSRRWRRRVRDRRCVRDRRRVRRCWGRRGCRDITDRLTPVQVAGWIVELDRESEVIRIQEKRGLVPTTFKATPEVHSDFVDIRALGYRHRQVSMGMRGRRVVVASLNSGSIPICPINVLVPAVHSRSVFHVLPVDVHGCHLETRVSRVVDVLADPSTIAELECSEGNS